MSKNTKLDRRHDVNAGEALPQRLTRVEDMEVYWDNIEKVTQMENDPEVLEKRQAEKEQASRALAEKKSSIQVGDPVVLIWNGLQVVRVEEVLESSVKIGPHRYGWEMVQKPSEAFLKAVEAEFPGRV